MIQTITAELVPIPGPMGMSYYVDTKQGRFLVNFIDGVPYINPPGYPPIRVEVPSQLNSSLSSSFYSSSNTDTIDMARQVSSSTSSFYPQLSPTSFENLQMENYALKVRLDELEIVVRNLSAQLSTQIPKLCRDVELLRREWREQTELVSFNDDLLSITGESFFPHIQKLNANTNQVPGKTTVNIQPPSPSQSLKENSIITASHKLTYEQSSPTGEVCQFKRTTVPQDIPTILEESAKLPSSSQDCVDAELIPTMTRYDVETWLIQKAFPLHRGALEKAKNSEGMYAIHFACHCGNVAVVDFLLNNGLATIHDRTVQQFTPLLRACRSGQLQIVEYLIAKGAKVDEKDSYGDTPLLSAAVYGHLSIVQYLLTQGSSLKERSTGLHSAIIRAAMNGRMTLVQWLLSNGSSAKEADKDGYTPLLCAALHGYLDLVKYLLSSPAYSSLTEISHSGNSAFLCAARDGHLEVIKFLATLDPNLRDHVDRRGTTVLMRACANGHLPLVEWILENYPDAVNDRDYEEDSPLSFASMAGHAQIAYHLLHPPKGDKIMDINIRNKLRYTPLIRSAMNGRKEMADFLLKEGADLTLADKDGFTAVLCAALHGYLPVLESLVLEAKKRYGTDAISKLRDTTTKAGRTLMICAARNGHLKIMEYLLENNLGTVNDKDCEGDTPLICAAMNNHVYAVKWLVEKGASSIQPNKAGHTAFIRASMNGRLTVVKWFLEDGVKFMKKDEQPKITDVDRDGYTATICAALHGHLELLKYLVKVKRAALNEKTYSGQTALLCAARNGKLEVVKWLLKKGANILAKDKTENTVLDCARRSNNLHLIDFLDKYLAPLNQSSL